MQATTLVIGILVSLIMLNVKPVSALFVYISTLIWYPTFLTVKVATADFSVHRILICVMCLRICLDSELLRSFRLLLIDKMVLAFAGLSLVAGLMTTDTFVMIEYWGGSVFDTVLPYFVLRFVLRRHADYVKLIVSVAWVSAGLACLGVYQWLSGDNLVGFMHRFSAFKTTAAEYSPWMRFGLYRANITFSHAIMFGLYFAILAGLYTGLHGYMRRKRVVFYGVLTCLVLGLVTSMSSGPALAAIAFVIVAVIYRYRRYWKICVGGIVVMFALLEIASNSPWYEAMSRLTFSEETAFYRVLLIRKTLGGGMSGHWLAGYGLVDPGWGPELFGKKHTDLVNQYVETVVTWGLLGLVPFVGIMGCAFKQLRRAFVRAVSSEDKWFIWSLMSTLVALSVSFMSVSLFAQTRTAFFLMLAVCATSPALLQVPSGAMLPAAAIARDYGVRSPRRRRVYASYSGG